MGIQEIAARLAAARQAGTKLTDYPGGRPADLSEAFAAQEAMITAMGRGIVGWKVGLTSEIAQQLCGYGAPLAGPVFAGDLHDSGVVLPMLDGDMGVLEAEIGLRMATDLPPRGRAYSRDEVKAAVGTVMPVIEWVNKRLPGGLREDAEWIIADGVINRCVICGPEQSLAPEMELADETLEVTIDGARVTGGVGANAMGGPIEVLTWLANDLNTRGRGLKSGDVVSTGLICDVVQAAPGAQVTARSATLGSVVLSVS